ncbi:hypothetical protein HELRODRAFT_192409 [Helobdella robusta]|uniref:Uncharacterized protein n=1 Tax=Helobdella robusta TaxID=6412 RepID=T1FTX4_HELRO|nr:hypothetical protein HELRODRAFT_192409 [Helobdella robusta]ESO00768.1 hypothetical protein HELRODRAFT_192409 [Helobdella robusta]
MTSVVLYPLAVRADVLAPKAGKCMKNPPATNFTTEAGSHEDRLINDIFNTRGYSPIARPVVNESDKVDVEYMVTLQSIINLDEKQEMLITRLWFEYVWVDPKLAWNPHEYGGLESIRLAWDKVWTPDILLYNSASPAIDTKYPVNIIVSNSGSCKWMPLGIYTSSCAIDIQWFPFDDQKCKLKFGSWTYHGNLLNLMQKNGTSGMNTELFQENGEWDLIDAPANRTVLWYSCCPDPYIDITYYLHIRRRALYYASNLIIPCALISILAIFTFLLPPDTNAKISLGITVLLALTVFQLIVADMVPSTSVSVPLIGKYFAFLMVMCTISLGITIVVINFHHRKPDMSMIPDYASINYLFISITEIPPHLPHPHPQIDKYVNNYLAWLVRLSRPGKPPRSPFAKDEIARTVNLDTTKFMVPSLPHPNSANARFATFLTMQNTRLTPKFPSVKDKPANSQPVKQLSEQSSKAKVELYKLKHEFGALLYEMKCITNHIKDIDVEADEISKWKFAAMVIDRCSFIIFSIYLFIFTVSIFFSSENLRNSLVN